VARHGGRHPLPDVRQLTARLASLGIHPGARVVAYDDARFAFAARFWWLLRALGYRPPELLDGGYAGWLADGGAVEQAVPQPVPCAVPSAEVYRGVVDITALASLQAAGSLLLDSRDPARYAGLEEPLDPVAGHIPGALNLPWQAVSDAQGCLLDDARLSAHFAGLPEGRPRVVYCGSGVTACVNLFALARTGDESALLYAGSWSDWCSHLTADE
jgi:thiosulfate/3-mercaptopyruvate sulfurtransferase